MSEKKVIPKSYAIATIDRSALAMSKLDRDRFTDMKYCTYCTCHRPHYVRFDLYSDVRTFYCAYCRNLLGHSKQVSRDDTMHKPFEEIQKINPPSGRLTEGNDV